MRSFIDEGNINEFLQTQKDLDGAVISWTYSSVRMSNIISHIKPEDAEGTYISDMAGYKPCRSEVYSVQRNYLDVLDLKYYYPNEFEEELIEAS